MADRGAVRIAWGEVRPGIEVAKAMGVLAGTIGRLDDLQKAGRISGYRVFGSILGSNGFVLMEGDLRELAIIQTEEETLNDLARAIAVVDGVKIELFAGGSADDVTDYYMKGLAAQQAAGLGS